MRFLLTSLLWLILCARSGAVVVDLDFTYDQANGDFFGQHPAAKLALQLAARDVNAALTGAMTTVTQDVFSGTANGATAQIDWSLNFANPSTGASVTLDSFTLQANEVRIYVGMRPLPGTELGEGSANGAGAGFSLSGASAGYAAAMTKAQAASDAQIPRGEGPVIGRRTGNLAGTHPDLAYGALVGSLSFDDDSNNDGAADSFATLDAYWHFDATTQPGTQQNDFYSVALHELLHALGFGASKTWNDLRSGTDWRGAAAIAENGGSGLNLVTADGHLRSDYQSTRLFDGAPQEALMDPSLTQGTRKYLTAMDAAILRDLGYTTIPEPSAGMLAGTGLILFAAARRRRNT